MVKVENSEVEYLPLDYCSRLDLGEQKRDAR